MDSRHATSHYLPPVLPATPRYAGRFSHATSRLICMPPLIARRDAASRHAATDNTNFTPKVSSPLGHAGQYVEYVMPSTATVEVHVIE